MSMSDNHMDACYVFGKLNNLTLLLIALNIITKEQLQEINEIKKNCDNIDEIINKFRRKN